MRFCIYILLVTLSMATYACKPAVRSSVDSTITHREKYVAPSGSFIESQSVFIIRGPKEE